MRLPNFVAGPSALPEPVLEQIRHELLDYQGTGKSILETSHRSPEFEAILDEANHLLGKLLGLGPEHEVLWLQGGASLQFSMVPLNLLQPDQLGSYVVTGVWSEKALAEAERVARAQVAASSAQSGHDHIPDVATWSVDPRAEYVHITSNNTIYGTQFRDLDIDCGSTLVCDMSSDFLSRPVPMSRFGLIYAGAQKNLGPAGVTLVIGRRDLLRAVRPDTPTMLRYDVHAKANSLYNTPPVFAVYASSLVLRWIVAQGGLRAMQAQAEAKAAAIYAQVDARPDVFRGRAQVASRSRMNLTFTLASPALEQQFLREAAQEGFLGLAGHRSAGGVRVSLYNAVKWSWAASLAEFMALFAERVG